MASIAAVSQVELKTKRADDTAGTYLEIDNSVVRKQEIIACASGTSIAMKKFIFQRTGAQKFS